MASLVLAAARAARFGQVPEENRSHGMSLDLKRGSLFVILC